jgi:deoxyribose-phosphate aldolase
MTSQQDIARLIDHTILKPDAVRHEVKAVCAEARKYGFASVCVNSFWTPLVASELRGGAVKVCTVAGFPLGAASTAAKVAEARAAVGDGAQEIDMVINLGALRGGETAIAEADIRAVADEAHGRGAILKVIIETALLSDEEKVLACRCAVAAGADFVKTSTGFSRSGATTDDVALMRRTVGPSIGVKASGGIRTLADLQAMVAAGANRIGASAGVQILEAAGDAGIGHAGY